jgi:uncharacterized protein
MRQIIPAAAIALLCLGGAAAPSWAQGAPPSALPPAAAVPAAPPSAEARGAARALTDMLGFDRQAQAMIQTMRAEMIQAVMRSNGKTPEEAVKVVDEVFMPDFTAQEPALLTALVDVWAATFTTQELKDLRAFYLTPLGQKLIASLPGMGQQGWAAGQAWFRTQYEEGLKKHATELSKRGIKL